ncbi:hypothetical protein D3C73_1290350 [compost metagenome]
MAKRTNTVITPPIRLFSRNKRIRMPPIRTRLLMSKMTKLEKKLPRALISPSTLSMIEPAVCFL